jgi:hypothetical protein
MLLVAALLGALVVALTLVFAALDNPTSYAILAVYCNRCERT